MPTQTSDLDAVLEKIHDQCQEREKEIEEAEGKEFFSRGCSGCIPLLILTLVVADTVGKRTDPSFFLTLLMVGFLLGILGFLGLFVWRIVNEYLQTKSAIKSAFSQAGLDPNVLGRIPSYVSDIKSPKLRQKITKKYPDYALLRPVESHQPETLLRPAASSEPTDEAQLLHPHQSE